MLFWRKHTRLVIFAAVMGISLVSAAQLISEEYSYAVQNINLLQQQINDLSTNINHQKQSFGQEIKVAMVRRVVNNYNYCFTAKEEQALVETVIELSEKYGINPLLITAIIETESHFDNYARSYMGARGLMQVMPVTGREIAKQLDIPWRGSRTLHEPLTNIRIGTHYFANLLKRFGDSDKALVASNQGPSRLNYQLRKGILSKRYKRKVMQAFSKQKRVLPLFA